MSAPRTWQAELPPEPEGVTAVTDSDGDLWLRVAVNMWAIRDDGPWSSWADILPYGPLTEATDPRAVQ